MKVLRITYSCNRILLREVLCIKRRKLVGGMIVYNYLFSPEQRGLKGQLYSPKAYELTDIDLLKECISEALSRNIDNIVNVEVLV